MKKLVIGILAHVDAGKTTLAEAMMFATGKIRKLGRVDHGDTVMDTDAIERERGITVFASQAVINTENAEIALLDTPGHIDFSAETERTLQVLDYAVLVISGTDGVQAHTRTIWRLLQLYNIPTFVFVTKMDFIRKCKEELTAELCNEFGEGFYDFSLIDSPEVQEEIALYRDDILDCYTETGAITDVQISELIAARRIFPCYFGSGMKLLGIDEFLSGIERFAIPKSCPDAFGARIYKITYDYQGRRITHMRVTGGKLRVRDTVITDAGEEKVSQIRIYSGAKFHPVNEVEANSICAVVGLNGTKNGQGLGFEASSRAPILEPVMTYQVIPPSDCDVKTLLTHLRRLEEEDPQLRVTWNERLQEIHIGLMGAVQAEILKSIISERFGVNILIGTGSVLYKETISNTVEGVGHYEPLKHYSEVHLLIEPAPRGSGVLICSKCSEDMLDRNWQRLVLTHLTEKLHLGVLTGSPITDVKITLMSGRAHVKHTEGGDFRQATYRAVRQGLMQADSVLLEPYYAFKIEVPTESIGRVISDIQMKSGSFEAPAESNGLMLLKGRAPVVELKQYASELAAFTGGRGKITLEPDGYDICHNSSKIIESIDYDPESDVENTPDSVFCAHGAGFVVKWNKVSEYMHIQSCLKSSETDVNAAPRYPIRIDDRELEEIMIREFGPVKRPVYSSAAVNSSDTTKETLEIFERTKWYIVDGYNVIFAWDMLHDVAERDLDSARSVLINCLCSFSSFTKNKVVVVFDAYKVSGNMGKKYDTGGINIAFTKENETADMYIEKLVSEIGKNEQVCVVTSDNLIRLSALRAGVRRISAIEFEREVERTNLDMKRLIKSINSQSGASIGETLAAKEDDKWK